MGALKESIARVDAGDLNIKWLKRLAKKLKKEIGIPHVECLHRVAKEQGYRHWDHLMRTYNNADKNGNKL